MSVSKSSDNQLINTSQESKSIINMNYLRSGIIEPEINGKIFPIGIKNFERSWNSICRKARITGLRFHDLKREAISRLFEKGLSIMVVLPGKTTERG